MEEWHQKLHNNSSPDDLAICQVGVDAGVDGAVPGACAGARMRPICCFPGSAAFGLGIGLMRGLPVAVAFVVISLQALLDYLASGQNMQVYWNSLAKEGMLVPCGRVLIEASKQSCLDWLQLCWCVVPCCASCTSNEGA